MAKDIFVKDPEKFIPALAEKLKKIPEFEVPAWAVFVKSGASRERPPVDDDFWYVRAASILRQLYIKGVVGVGKLRSRYGSRKDRGGRPGKFRKASGKIIRVILQQAEAAGLVEKVDKLQHGRRLTQTGRDFLDSIDVPIKSIDSSEWTTASINQVVLENDEEIENIDEDEEKNEIKDGEENGE
jgi:small subunit ribosomal protein S19e